MAPERKKGPRLKARARGVHGGRRPSTHEWILFKAGHRRVDLVQGEVSILFMAPQRALRDRWSATYRSPPLKVITLNGCADVELAVFNA
jgi:hypothetical protein